MKDFSISQRRAVQMPTPDNRSPENPKSKKIENPPETLVNSENISENFSAKRGIDNNLTKSILNVKMENFAAQSVTYPTVHIPPDRRHDEIVSKYDLKPVSNREPGDPDRYRAVNPKYVKLEADGNRYYRMELVPGSRHYGSDLSPGGILEREEIKVDFSRQRKVDGVSYVGVDTGGYVRLSALKDANRGGTVSVSNVKESRAFKMTINPGEHQLYDGAGVPRGSISDLSVKLNYGIEKEMNGEKYFYAFSTRIDPNNDTGTESKGASGWIKASSIVEGERPYYSAADVERLKNPPIPNETVFEKYEITGGNPTASNLGYMKNGQFISYKVLPGQTTSNVAATDYIKRSDNVINLGYNVAGASKDTFRVDGNPPLVFNRSSGAETTATIDLYYPKDADHAGEVPVGKMTFVYGFVETPSGNRWGWMALDALKPKP